MGKESTPSHPALGYIIIPHETPSDPLAYPENKPLPNAKPRPAYDLPAFASRDDARQFLFNDRTVSHRFLDLIEYRVEEVMADPKLKIFLEHIRHGNQIIAVGDLALASEPRGLSGITRSARTALAEGMRRALRGFRGKPN